MTLNKLSRQHLWVGLALFAVAFVLRLGVIAAYPVSPLAGGDQTAFWSFAQGIAAGQGFRSTFEPWLADRPPLYSFYLAGVFQLVGQERQMVFIAQAILGTLSAGLFYWVAVRIMDSARGFCAGLLFAILPHYLLFTKQILTEALYLPLLVLLLALLVIPESIDKFYLWFLIGITVGFLILVRREALLPALLLVIGIGWIRLEHKRLWASAVIGLGALLVVLPWIARNQIVLGAPVLSSSAGVNFMVGNNPDADGGYTPPPSEWSAKIAGLGELERDRVAWDLSLQWVREDPARFLELLPAKLAHLWGPAHNLILDGIDLVLIPFYIIGLIHLYHRQKGWQLVAVIVFALVVSNLFVGLIYVGGWRYRLAIYPALCLLAAYGIPARWLERIAQLRSQSRAPTARLAE